VLSSTIDPPPAPAAMVYAAGLLNVRVPTVRLPSRVTVRAAVFVR
jgi:hypothetical protein